MGCQVVFHISRSNIKALQHSTRSILRLTRSFFDSWENSNNTKAFSKKKKNRRLVLCQQSDHRLIYGSYSVVSMCAFHALPAARLHILYLGAWFFLQICSHFILSLHADCSSSVFFSLQISTTLNNTPVPFISWNSSFLAQRSVSLVL